MQHMRICIYTPQEMFRGHQGIFKTYIFLGLFVLAAALMPLKDIVQAVYMIPAS